MVTAALCTTSPARLHCARRLLGESWRAVRAPLQEALRSAAQKTPELAADCAALGAAARKLDDALVARASAGDAWRLYRRLLVFYSQVRAVGAAPGAARVQASREGG
jgi:hypothetical protein